MEAGTAILKRQLATAFSMADISQAREFLNSVKISEETLPAIRRTPVSITGIRGDWFEPPNSTSPLTVLYFHGGGYSFYPASYSYFVQLVLHAVNCRLFSLDYPLAPEHTFPAQLENAIDSYKWLLQQHVHPEHLVLAGDSAGGHLAIASALKARELQLPMPALIVAMSPAVGLETSAASLTGNQPFDWIQPAMLEQWAACFCSLDQRTDPLISLFRADLRGLAPIYIQCGESEILYDGIQEFGSRARAQGAQVTIDAWPNMNHVFQFFGSFVPQSVAALSRIGKILAQVHDQPSTDEEQRHLDRIPQ